MKPKPTVVVVSPDDPILTTGAAASLLGISISTMQLWINNGAVVFWTTPGGHRRVRLSAIVALAQKNGCEVTMPKERIDSANPDMSVEFLARDRANYLVAGNEIERLRALAATGLVDTLPERVFDRLTWLASQIAGTPMALVSLVTSCRQWFKSRVGIEVAETPREWAFCGHAIQGDKPFVVSDATNDQRFWDNPLVTGKPFIRFYAGIPVTDESGHRMGTLCVLDSRPRALLDEQLLALQELAAIASEEIARRS